MTNLSPTSLHESLQVNDDCALPHALNIMGEKWAFMILRASFNGIRHFEGYLAEIGIARNILANRLSRLTENGILIRTPCPKDRRKVEYQLTEKGLDLLPVMIAFRQWGEKWGTGIASNPVLVDERDHQPIKKVTIRGHDDRILKCADLCWIDNADLEENNRNSNNADSKKLRKIGSSTP